MRRRITNETMHLEIERDDPNDEPLDQFDPYLHTRFPFAEVEVLFSRTGQGRQGETVMDAMDTVLAEVKTAFQREFGIDHDEAKSKMIRAIKKMKPKMTRFNVECIIRDHARNKRDGKTELTD